MGWEEAESFRLSSFAAAIQLNGLECFELERPQPHNLVTCQPRHVGIVVAIGEKRSDRTTQIENLLSKRKEEEPPYKILLAAHVRFSDAHVRSTFYFHYTRCIWSLQIYGRYASNAGTSSLCATVRYHLRSHTPESPGFFPLPHSRVPGIFVLRSTLPHTGPLLKDDYTSFWGVPFN